MEKRLYAIILFITVFCLEGFSQAIPPYVKNASDSVGTDHADIFISFSPNDTGTILANVVVQKGQGNSVYDSTYILTAADSANAAFTVDSLIPCTQYQVLTILSNHNAVGLQVNPQLTFQTLCTIGVAQVSENRFALLSLAQSIEIHADEVPANASIDIYDLTGRLILNNSFNQSVQQIPFHQNAGIYLLRITGNGQSLYTNRFATF